MRCNRCFEDSAPTFVHPPEGNVCGYCLAEEVSVKLQRGIEACPS